MYLVHVDSDDREGQVDNDKDEKEDEDIEYHVRDADDHRPGLTPH